MEFSQYLSLYCEAETAGAKLPSEIKDYIDHKLEDVDAGGTKYNVIPSGKPGHLLVVDVEDGSVTGNIDSKGKLISVPVVYGDQVSFAVQDDSGRVSGTLRSLPDGAIINQFRVGEPKPGMKYKEVMGREVDPKAKDDDDGFPDVM